MAIVLVLCAYLLVPLVLVAFHAAMFRWLRQPPPLFARALPISLGRSAAIGGAGVIDAYLVPVVVLVSSLATEGVEGGLSLQPVAGGPAASAGVESGDRAVAANGKPLTAFHELQAEVKSGAGDSIALDIERNGQRQTVVILKENGVIGVRGLPETLPLGEAIRRGLAMPAIISVQYVRDAFDLVTRRREVVVAGPFAIVNRVGPYNPLSILGVLMSSQLVYSLAVYLTALVLDARSRERFRSSRTVR